MKPHKQLHAQYEMARENQNLKAVNKHEEFNLFLSRLPQCCEYTNEHRHILTWLIFLNGDISSSSLFSLLAYQRCSCPFIVQSMTCILFLKIKTTFGWFVRVFGYCRRVLTRGYGRAIVRVLGKGQEATQSFIGGTPSKQVSLGREATFQRFDSHIILVCSCTPASCLTLQLTKLWDAHKN